MTELRYRCLRCRREFSRPAPGPTECPHCAHRYVRWLNVRAWHQACPESLFSEDEVRAATSGATTTACGPAEPPALPVAPLRDGPRGA